MSRSSGKSAKIATGSARYPAGYPLLRVSVMFYSLKKKGTACLLPACNSRCKSGSLLMISLIAISILSMSLMISEKVYPVMSVLR